MLTTTKEVKAKLVPLFGLKNVSVTRGNGTASGWIHANVTINTPADCFCDPGVNRCASCSEAWKKADMMIDAAVKGLQFSSYYSDDYSDSTPRSCFLTQIRFTPKVAVKITS